MGTLKFSVLMPSMARRCCALCAGDVHGLAHILATCGALDHNRQQLLEELSSEVAGRLAVAPAGDWPVILLSLHQCLKNLLASVRYCAAVVRLIEVVV